MTLSTLRARRAGIGLLSVAVALVGFLVVGILGSLATSRAAVDVERAVLLDAAYGRAATGVAAEESLERKYRLQPGPVPLAAHVEARAQVRRALSEIKRLGTPKDRQLVNRVSGEHTGYVRAALDMFAAVDRHESAEFVNAIDGTRVDPVFDAMQSETFAAAAQHRAGALDRLNSLQATERLAFGLAVGTLIVGITLIATAAIALVRYERRLRTQSQVNRHQALHDGLTGLPNRTLFQDRTVTALQAARRSGEQAAVLLVDLNRFKDVNDTLGHYYGDLLLEQIAARFTGTLRAGDSVARLGGDEFAVLLCSTSPEQAVAAAARLSEALATSFSVKDISLDVDASIGIALAGPDSDVETLLRHADVAMYEAKSQHIPHAEYELTRDDNTLARLALLGDLRRAITGGELVLYYQPKIVMATGALDSVEALVRWHHPSRGLLLPDDFIPIAEGTAVIHPLTHEILRLALTQARGWLDRGWSIPVSVNISARSLHDPTFPAEVHRQLLTLGVPARLLCLELTEGTIMTDPHRALTSLKALNEMGVRLSIDDFGTGYSSMSYLKDLPVHELKIDRSFVVDMTRNEGNRVLVQSAVDLGHNLGLSVVAEGVEDAKTQIALAALGCDLVQGFHVQRPAEAVAIEPWLRAHAIATLGVAAPEETSGQTVS
jgi:diguanylate cyclase (GGDEF)-like protein